MCKCHCNCVDLRDIKQEAYLDALNHISKESRRDSIKKWEYEEYRKDAWTMLFPQIKKMINEYDEIVKETPLRAVDAQEKQEKLTSIIDKLTWFISYYK